VVERTELKGGGLGKEEGRGGGGGGRGEGGGGGGGGGYSTLRTPPKSTPDRWHWGANTPCCKRWEWAMSL